MLGQIWVYYYVGLLRWCERFYFINGVISRIFISELATVFGCCHDGVSILIVDDDHDTESRVVQQLCVISSVARNMGKSNFVQYMFCLY